VNISGGNYPGGYYIDDVSVIPLDSMQLKADAGRDTTIVKGDSVWIGSRLCGLTNVVWYDDGGNVIDTGVPGLWVKPTANTFYVIEQNVCGQYSRDTVYINVQALPVIITNYELRITNGIQKNGVANIWETSTEINTAYYNVQRSADGVNFEIVGTVRAKGAGSYSYTDLTPIPSPKERDILYYRLEVVDKNGSVTYSDIKEISISNSPFSIFPNPAKDVVNISGKNISGVKVSDVVGRVLINLSFNNVTNPTISLKELSVGVYYLSVTTTDGQVKTMVVEKEY